MAYLYLIVAIVCEVIATLALKSVDGFSKIGPSLIVVTGYGLAFYYLSICMKFFPIGIIYAIWSGAGIVLIALFSFLVYKQTVDVPAIIGIALIIIGVAVINLFSSSVVH